MPHYHINIQPALEERAITRIVEAKNQARAIAFVVEDTITVRVAKPEDFMTLAAAGGKIEKAPE